MSFTERRGLWRPVCEPDDAALFMVNRSLISFVASLATMIVRQFLQWIEAAPPQGRAEAAHVLARAYLHSEVDEETRSGMEAAMTVLLDDPSPDVRYALADAVAASPEAPRHIVLTLAGDLVEIAALVLSRSPLFIDAELVDIVAAADEPLQVAVAGRSRVLSPVAAAIAEVGEPASVRALLENEGAEIARISLRRIAERFGDEPAMRELMLARPTLPPEIRQMLIRRLSDALGSLVVSKSWVADDRARTFTRDACDRATVALAAESETEELPALVEHLRVTGQLTTALLLRAVCAGNIGLFEAALSVLARVPEARVASLVRAGRLDALRAVYAKAGLPPVAFDAFAAALEACRVIAEEGAPRDRYRFTRHMVESVIAGYRDITDGEMNELMMMLRRFAADQARDAARDYARQAVAAA
jgi:uncharacterized protein (DUF2336 family)